LGGTVDAALPRALKSAERLIFVSDLCREAEKHIGQVGNAVVVHEGIAKSMTAQLTTDAVTPKKHGLDRFVMAFGARPTQNVAFLCAQRAHANFQATSSFSWWGAKKRLSDFFAR
jgi:hypothetical protein